MIVKKESIDNMIVFKIKELKRKMPTLLDIDPNCLSIQDPI